MKHVLLMGVSDGTGWLPLLLPFVGIVVIYYVVQFSISGYKNWKERHTNKLFNGNEEEDHVNG